MSVGTIILIVVAIILYILIGNLILYLNLGKHACIKCKEVKKGVMERPVYYHGRQIKQIYYCNECFKKRATNGVVYGYDEEPEPTQIPDCDLDPDTPIDYAKYGLPDPDKDYPFNTIQDSDYYDQDEE
jgi:hypothetical protein